QICAAYRPRAKPENRFIERCDELRTITVHQSLDERAPNDIGFRIACEPVLQLCTGTRRIAEKDRAADRGGPKSGIAAEQRSERLAQLLRLERPVLEERQLPAVERFAELRVVVGEREPGQKIGREAGAEGIEPRRFAGGLRRGNRQDGTDSVGSPVEALEQDRARCNRRRGGETDRGDRVGELTGR